MSSEPATAATEAGLSTGLLSFYDRLRARVVAYVDRRETRLGAAAADTILLVPDLFMLLARLSLDQEVPASSRSLVAGALMYFVVPFDLLPEAVLGAGGFLDDVVVAVAVLSHALGGQLEPLAARHWSGSQQLRVVLRDLTQASDALLGAGLYSRVRSLLRRHGVEIPLEKAPQ